jgi:site-specific recombinase XerD
MLTMWLESYIEHLENEGKSAATIRAVRADLHGLQRWWEESYQRRLDFRHLTQRDVRRWIEHRQQVDGARPATINRGLSSLHTFSFSRRAVSEGLLVENPAAGIEEVASVQVAPAGLSPIDIDELLRSAALTGDTIQRRRDEACLALLNYGGLRIQECCDVQVRDLDMAGGNVVVRSGKGGKHRRVPLSRDARQLLQRYLADARFPAGLPKIGDAAEREPLLIGRRMIVAGQPWLPGVQPQSMRKRLKELGQLAAQRLQTMSEQESDLQRSAELRQASQQVKNVTPHQLRHSLAWRMLKNGATLPEVQRILGHTRLTTTGMYLNPSTDDLRDAVEKGGI